MGWKESVPLIRRRQRRTAERRKATHHFRPLSEYIIREAAKVRRELFVQASFVGCVHSISLKLISLGVLAKQFKQT